MASSMIGANLKALMDKHSLTVSDLADRSGVSASTINRIRNGRSPNTSTSTINALCAALSCTTADLIGAEAVATIQTDIQSAMMAQQEAYERQIDSDEHHNQMLIAALEESKRRTNRRSIGWMVIAIAALIAFATVFGSYQQFRWDVSHPTEGNIQYATIEELKEILNGEQ